MSTKKSTTSTELATANQFSDAGVASMLETINAKIKSLEGDKEKSSRITGTLMGMKVSDVKDTDTLRSLYAYITKKSESIKSFDDIFKAASPITSISEYKEGGANVKQWQAEIITQYREVTYKEELDKLKEAKKQLEECLSEEMKREAKLANVANLLKVN